MAVSLRWKLFGALTAAILATACGGDDSKDNPDKTPDPNGNTDAGGQQQQPPPSSGGKLNDDVAGTACTNDAACGPNGRCANDLSLAGALGGLGGGGAMTPMEGDAKGGYCTKGCRNNSECGKGGVCLGSLLGLTEGTCRKACTAETDCRSGEGYECAKINPAVSANAGDAGAGLPAELRDGLDTLLRQGLPAQCQPVPSFPTNVPAQAIGKACTRENAAQVCGDANCVLGFCGAGCKTDANCGAGAACVGDFVYGSLGKLCVETCETAADCAQANAECTQPMGATRKFCTPRQQTNDGGTRPATDAGNNSTPDAGITTPVGDAG